MPPTCSEKTSALTPLAHAAKEPVPGGTVPRYSRRTVPLPGAVSLPLEGVAAPATGVPSCVPPTSVATTSVAPATAVSRARTWTAPGYTRKRLTPEDVIYSESVVASPGEVEARHLQRGDPGRGEEELAHHLRVLAHELHRLQRLQDRLREPEVLHRVFDLSALHQPGPIASHPRDHRLGGVHDVRVVESGHEQSALGGLDHPLE